MKTPFSLRKIFWTLPSATIIFDHSQRKPKMKIIHFFKLTFHDFVILPATTQPNRYTTEPVYLLNWYKKQHQKPIIRNIIKKLELLHL